MSIASNKFVIVILFFFCDSVYSQKEDELLYKMLTFNMTVCYLASCWSAIAYLTKMSCSSFYGSNVRIILVV